MPRTMSAADFKAKCLQAVEQVATTGEPNVVKKHGKPIAQLAPVARRPKTLRGLLKGRVKTRKESARSKPRGQPIGRDSTRHARPGLVR